MTKKTHWLQSYNNNLTACGQPEGRVTRTVSVEAVTCGHCKKAIVAEFNILMEAEPTKERFLRVQNSICMRAEEPSKLIYILFEAPVDWIDQGQSAVIQQYADEIVEMLNERYGS